MAVLLYFLVKHYHWTSAVLVVKSDVEKQQLANEIATLMIEVARKAQAQDAARIRLAQVTAVANSNGRRKDWADPLDNPFDDTFDDPFAESQPLTTTGGAGLQPTPPDGEPPFDLNKVFESIRANLGPITSFLITTVGGTVAVKAVRGDNAQLSKQDKQKLSEMDAYRQQHGMPESKYDKETGTLAVVNINGEDFYGHSTKIERQIFGYDNRTLRESLLNELQASGWIDSYPYGHPKTWVVLHAEAEALLKAREQLGSLKGKEVTLYVDRRTCDECYQHLPIIMALWGIEKITIISSDEQYGDQTIIITNQNAAN